MLSGDVNRQSGKDMRRFSITRRAVLSTLLCLALTVWSVMPSFTHAPDVFETIQDHVAMIADHGHSHGFAEDMYWALHGHSHDAADHDHSQAIPMPGTSSETPTAFSDPLRLRPSPGGPGRIFRIERPPRA